jgi:hypothetical protein
MHKLVIPAGKRIIHAGMTILDFVHTLNTLMKPDSLYPKTTDSIFAHYTPAG